MARQKKTPETENEPVSQSYDEFLAEIGNLNLEDLQAKMHTELARHLLYRVAIGVATAQELNVARQFLKDNGVSGEPSNPKSPLGGLASKLPFTDEGTEGHPGRTH